MTLFLTILGLVLTAVSLITLIELFPRLSVSPEPPFESQNVVPAFSIKNDGYFSVSSVEPACFISKMRSKIINMDRSWSARNANMGTTKSLPSTQSVTVSCGMNLGLPARAIDEMDLAVVVYFRPWPFNFIRKRRIFRFVAHQGRDGLIFHRQMFTDEIEREIDDIEREDRDFSN